MESQNDPDEDLVAKAANDTAALNELFAIHRERLRMALRLRISPELQRRIDESDIIQEVLTDASRNFASYAADPQLPFYLWIRHLAGLKLAEAHRRHVKTGKRSTRKESYLETLPNASTHNLAAALIEQNTPEQSAIRREKIERVRKGLDDISPIDREILAIRHFEQLSIAESARVLGLSKAATGERYLRALTRLGKALSDTDDLD